MRLSARAGAGAHCSDPQQRRADSVHDKCRRAVPGGLHSVKVNLLSYTVCLLSYTVSHTANLLSYTVSYTANTVIYTANTVVDQVSHTLFQDSAEMDSALRAMIERCGCMLPYKIVTLCARDQPAVR